MQLLSDCSIPPSLLAVSGLRQGSRQPKRTAQKDSLVLVHLVLQVNDDFQRVWWQPSSALC